MIWPYTPDALDQAEMQVIVGREFKVRLEAIVLWIFGDLL